MTRPQYNSLYERLVANTEVVGECWLWTGAARNKRYPSFTMRVAGRPYPVAFAAHRAMLELFTGFEAPDDEAGHYICFTPTCCNPDHLRWETREFNLSLRRTLTTVVVVENNPRLVPTAETLFSRAVDEMWTLPGRIYSPTEPCPF